MEQANHTIRLHGPWQYSVIAPSEGSSAPRTPSGTIQIPADWGATLGTNFRGRVRYVRSFGKPTGIDTGERVELVFECVDPSGSIELNGSPLGNIPPGLAPSRFDITQLLRPRNQLSVEVELPIVASEQPQLIRPGRDALPGGIVGAVRLEIFTFAH